MCNAFSKIGLNVVLFVESQKKLGKQLNDVFNFYGVNNNFKIIKLKKMKIKGHTHIYVLYILAKIFNEKESLVYSRDLFGCFYSTLCGMDTMLESHTPVFYYQSKLAKLLFKILINRKNFKKLIVISEALKNYYIQNFPELTDKILVAHDGADVSKNIKNIGRKKDWPGRNDALKIGYMGHLYNGKGIEIISKLCKILPEFDFHIIGGTEEDINHWKKKVIGKNILFHGFIPPNKLEIYRQKFDILLAPYQMRVCGVGKGGDIGNWMSPLKIFEYMSSGVPIIASDLTVLREVLQDEFNALLVPPDDINKWKDAILRLRNDPDLSCRIAKNAKAEFNKKYTWEKRARIILNY